MTTDSIEIASRLEILSMLENSASDLQSSARTTESQIRTVARVFESLAGHTDTILNLAAAVVGCVEKENIASVSPKIQTLGAAARRVIGDRLQATTGILQTVTTEVKLLHQLLLVSKGQEAIAVKIKALSVLTNIEVAHLGTVGASFQYLANELADFSMSVIKDTQQLASHADTRRQAIEETQRILSAELPRQREELARIEGDLSNALAAVDSSLTDLSRTPAQFKGCVEDVAAQIAGVVAAIQAHDITRQQIEHVLAAFALITTRMRDAGKFHNKDNQQLSEAYAGLTIQIYQLRAIKQTIASWASQISTCMSGILRVSTSDVVGIGPAVLLQEREVSSQLARIERLERESQAYSGRIRQNLGGLSSLVQLVSEHVRRSKSIRDRLRLLTFNSIIEASRLGTQADAILAIAKCIKEVSTEWNQITDQSGHAMEEMMNMVKHTNEAMEVFSEAGNGKFKEAQEGTRSCLTSLRTAAASAAREGQQMKVVTDKMRAKTAEIGNTGNLLNVCFRKIDTVVTEIACVQRQLRIDQPGLHERCDDDEAERLFAASYTTETERAILHAALQGTALPPAPQTFAGNSVELF